MKNEYKHNDNVVYIRNSTIICFEGVCFGIWGCFDSISDKYRLIEAKHSKTGFDWDDLGFGYDIGDIIEVIDDRGKFLLQVIRVEGYSIYTRGLLFEDNDGKVIRIKKRI